MELLYILLVLLVVTRACGEIAIRAGQPALVGELLAGVGLGVLAAQFSESLPVLAGLSENEVFKAVTELGIFFLMLLGGIDLQAREIVRSSAGAVWVAVAGFVVPLGLGFGLAWISFPASDVKLAQCLFVGTALAITAIPVAVKVLMDLGKLDSKPGQMIVSAAVIDDVLSLILLAILLAVVRTGSFPGFVEFAVLLLEIGAFFAITVGIGLFARPRIERLLERARIEEFEFSSLLIAALAYALLAEILGLHFILGAFIAGLLFSRRMTKPKIYNAVRDRVSGITTGFLAPIFFASIGLHLDLSAVTAVPIFLVLLILAAVIGKLVGAGIAARAIGMRGRNALSVGVGLSGRGAVELIIADIALGAGLFAMPEPVPPVIANLYSAVVIMAIVTTFATPLILQRVLKSDDK